MTRYATITMDVLADDTDEDCDELFILSLDQPDRGTVTQQGNVLVYTNNGEDSYDKFYYVASDCHMTDRAKVMIKIRCIRNFIQNDLNNLKAKEKLGLLYL